MQFTKYSGLGNDFVFLDGPTAQAVKDPFALARKICDRRNGVGADGLILLLPSQQADVKMRIINSDGSEAEMCGNASRCVPLHLHLTGQTQQKTITLETLAGLIKTEIVDEKKHLVRVNMGTPKLLRGQIPITGNPEEPAQNIALTIDGQTFTGTGVSMGNPHFVIFVPDIAQIPLAQIGPQIETHPLFPQKTNVEFVQLLNDTCVRMRVWERGAGITRACGTGACATAVACILSGKTQRQVNVQLDGGDLLIEWPEHRDIFMTGPAQQIFTGDFNDDPM
jgi:diaminopimelate epimerase